MYRLQVGVLMLKGDFQSSKYLSLYFPCSQRTYSDKNNMKLREIMVNIAISECLLKCNECLFDPIAVNVYVQLINKIWKITVAFNVSLSGAQ